MTLPGGILQPKPAPLLEFVGRASPLLPGAWTRAARRLNCDAAAIRAVAVQESMGRTGYLPDRRPRILFEAHWFGKLTRHRWDRTHPNISTDHWDVSLYRGGALEYERLHEAASLNRHVALQSASWGRFQIMGFNHANAGSATVEDFVEAMCDSEDKQLEAFVRLVTLNGRMLKALQQKQWGLFAYLYNGEEYRRNQYDVHMARYYERFSRDPSTYWK